MFEEYLYKWFDQFLNEETTFNGDVSFTKIYKNVIHI
jgi:hypothetical protein